MRFSKYLFIGIAALCLISQSLHSQPISLKTTDHESKLLADSILQVALDREGLYTILGDLKPISTVFHLYLPLAKDSLHKDGDNEILSPGDPALQKIKRYQQALQHLENDSIGFFFGPFKMAQGKTRAMQLIVYKKRLVADLVREHQSFFGQWGFTPSTQPEMIIHTIEFESKHDRFRGYGYLFGYPKHAVDFFVQASLEQEVSGEFVKRNFYQIPVFVGEEGHFVYAVPEGYEAGEIDLNIRERALIILERYKLLRGQFLHGELLSSLSLLSVW